MDRVNVLDALLGKNSGGNYQTQEEITTPISQNKKTEAQGIGMICPKTHVGGNG